MVDKQQQEKEQNLSCMSSSTNTSTNTNTNTDENANICDTSKRLEKVFEEKSNDHVDLLNCITAIVTLGTPHSSPEPGCMDITRGALR